VPLWSTAATKGARFLATEAASSLGLYLSRSVALHQFGALTPDIALKGLIDGASLMSGALPSVLCCGSNRKYSAGDGWDHAGGGISHAMERNLVGLTADCSSCPADIWYVRYCFLCPK
jgi:hypothetical protein